MGAPHRDLPPGSQRWAEQVDALMDEVTALKGIIARLCQDARIDPSDPYKNMNVGGDTPAANSPVQTRITQLSDVNAYNVADKQALTWSQPDQAFVPVTPTLAGLADVNVAGVTNSQVLAYDGTTQEWVPSTPASGGGGGGVTSFHPNDSNWITTSHATAIGMDITTPSEAPSGWYGWDSVTGEFEIRSVVTKPSDSQQYLGNIAFVRGTMYLSVMPWSYGGNGAQIILDSVTGVVDCSAGTNGIATAKVTSSTRPSSTLIGGLAVTVFDTTLGKPIWWNGTNWVDATGATV